MDYITRLFNDSCNDEKEFSAIKKRHKNGLSEWAKPSELGSDGGGGKSLFGDFE